MAVRTKTPRKRTVRVLQSKRLWQILLGMAVVGSVLRPYIPGIRYLGSSGVFRRGIELYERQRYAEALPYFKRAAEGGNTHAMTNLGVMYGVVP